MSDTFQKKDEVSNSIGMKKTRKTRKVPLTNIIEEVKEIKENEPLEIIQEVSYHKAKALLPKRQMSEKQQANVLKLVASNKLRRDLVRADKDKEIMKQELLKKIEEEQKLKDERKLVKIKTIVRPKAVYKKKVKKFELKPDSEYDPYTETEGDSTDTTTIKKAQKKIKKINDIIQPVAVTEPFNSVNYIMKHL